MVAAEWLGGEVRPVRSGCCALVCGLNGFTVGARRDIC